MIKFMKNVQREVKVKKGKDLSENEIQKVILKQENYLPVDYVECIRSAIADEVDHLILDIKERYENLEYKHIIFVGGGASVVRDYKREKLSFAAFETDITCNAKGYEFLAAKLMRKRVA